MKTLNSKTKETVEIVLSNIVANMPGHVYWKNKEGVYLGCNDRQARSLGFSDASMLIGKTDFELPWGDGVAEKFRKNDQLVMETGIMQLVEEPSQMEGRDVVVLSQKTPIKDTNGDIIGVLGISLDISDRKKMEEELQISKTKAEVASRAKTEFIANMSHDIRTPLTGIIGMSHQLEEEVTKPDERQHAKWVHESGEQLLDLLNGVLDMVSTGAANENEVKHEPFDLYQLVQDVLSLERSAVKVRQLDIKLHMDGAVPHYVVSDRMKLHRILLNLLGNSIKFTHQGHVGIEVRLLSCQGDMAQIEFRVVDSGIGIPDHLQDKVFDRFFKINPSNTGLYKGNGIGLHIAQNFVELLGGKISLTSQVDVGTTFLFVLSLKVGQAPDVVVEPPVGASAVVDGHLPKRRVLLVEDNFIALQVLKKMVEGFSVDVIDAMDAESALELVKAQPFDLVLTDVGLPGLSGDELAKSIRTWEKENHKRPMRIIGLTGHAEAEVAQRCLDAGMNQVEVKPMGKAGLEKIMGAL
ncbi:MAG: ATP-binding protein [Gammaproteobacteria bacterium]|nr:ATP-binding protein [Gammaproteobacteria bacterium]